MHKQVGKILGTTQTTKSRIIFINNSLFYQNMKIGYIPPLVSLTKDTESKPSNYGYYHVDVVNPKDLIGRTRLTVAFAPDKKQSFEPIASGLGYRGIVDCITNHARSQEVCPRIIYGEHVSESDRRFVSNRVRSGLETHL